MIVDGERVELYADKLWNNIRLKSRLTVAKAASMLSDKTDEVDLGRMMTEQITGWQFSKEYLTNCLMVKWSCTVLVKDESWCEWLRKN